MRRVQPLLRRRWRALGFGRRLERQEGRRLQGQRDVEAAATIAWDRARRWTSTLTALAGRNADNGSGYFNYHRRGLRQELTWHPAPWKFRLTGRAARYDYDVQTQGIGMNPPARLKEEFLAQARIERAWTPRALIFTELTWERSRSNDPLATYRVQTVSAGVDWAY